MRDSDNISPGRSQTDLIIPSFIWFGFSTNNTLDHRWFVSIAQDAAGNAPTIAFQNIPSGAYLEGFPCAVRVDANKLMFKERQDIGGRLFYLKITGDLDVFVNYRIGLFAGFKDEDAAIASPGNFSIAMNATMHKSSCLVEHDQRQG